MAATACQRPNDALHARERDEMNISLTVCDLVRAVIMLGFVSA